MENDDIIKAIDALKVEINELNHQRFFTAHNSWWKLIWFNLVRGLFFGLGSVLGATLLVYFVIQLLAQINFIPIIGEWATELIGIINASPST